LFNLGLLYEDGVGVKQDVDRAFELYAAAAKRGHPQAQRIFGNARR
jgi:TPR repeat protein